MANLNTSYLGLKLKNPLIAGSSGLTNSVQDIVDLEKNGAGAIVLKSIFEEEITSAMGRRVSGEGTAIPDPMAFDYQYYQSKDKKLAAYLTLIEESKNQVDIPVIASINCMSEFEWCLFAQKIEDAGADAIELNVFVSPMDFTNTSDDNEQLYFDLAEQVKKNIKLPVSMKITPYSANLGPFINRLSETGLDGIVMFNRLMNLDFDIENLKVVPSNVLSKTEEYHQALRWTALMSGEINCDLSASTGVHNGETIIKFLLAGASTVQIVSALYKQEKTILREFLKELEFWRGWHGYASIKDFRGKMSQSKSEDPSVYERVQFMRYFRGQE